MSCKADVPFLVLYSSITQSTIIARFPLPLYSQEPKLITRCAMSSRLDQVCHSGCEGNKYAHCPQGVRRGLPRSN